MNDDVVVPRNPSVPLEIKFTLLGSFDPNFVTNYLVIVPTYTKVKFDSDRGKRKIVKDQWTISKTYYDYYNTDKYIDEFLNGIKNISGKLEKLRSDFEIEGVLSCVIWIEEDTSPPNIYLSESAIAHLKELGCSFNVSLYFL